MLDDIHVTEQIPAYALGCLEEDEARRVSEHLTICAACRAELVAYQAVVDQLALAAPEATPSTAIKQRLMRQIRPRSQPGYKPRSSWWQSLAGLLQRAAPAWGLISLVLIIVLATTNILLWQRLGRDPTRDMRFVALVATDAAPHATGVLVIDPHGEYGTLVVDGLPSLDTEHQYQLWLIHNGERTSGGIFSVGYDGYGALEVYAPEPLSFYTAFGITIEPAGGSPHPTGPKVLGSSL